MFLYLHLFKVQFNNSVSIIGNIFGGGHQQIFIPEGNSAIMCKCQFDRIIKTGCDPIGRKINYLNTIIFEEKKIFKSCVQKKCKQEKEKCVWHEVYTLFLFYMFIFLTNDNPVIKILRYTIIFLILAFWKSIEVFVFFSRLWRQSVRKKNLAEARPVHAKQMSLYTFIILRKNNRHSWRLNKSSKTFKINGNVWVFLNCSYIFVIIK